MEPIIWLQCYMTQDQLVFLLEAASPLLSSRSTELTGSHLHTLANQQTGHRSYLENMETYRTTLAILAVLTEGNFHTAFSSSCRNGEGKAGIDIEGGEVPATSSTLPSFPASVQLHCLPFTRWEFFTESSVGGWRL